MDGRGGTKHCISCSCSLFSSYGWGAPSYLTQEAPPLASTEQERPMLKPPLPLWNSPLCFSSQSESYATVHFQRLGIHKRLLCPRALNTFTASGFWKFCHEEVIPGTLGIASILWDFLVLSVKTLKRFYPEHSHTDRRAVTAGPSLHRSATTLSGKITQDATHGLTVNNAGREATPATSDGSLNF